MKLDTIGGRRWLAFLLVIGLATGALWAGKLTGDQWLGAVTWAYGIFATGNVTQRAVEAARDVKTGATPTT